MAEQKTLADLTAMVDGTLEGDPTVIVCGVNDLSNAEQGEISFLANIKQAETLQQTKASAVVAPIKCPSFDIPMIRVRDPYLAFAIIHNFFLADSFKAKGIHKSAVVGDDCHISEEVTIGANAVIGDRVAIGCEVTIGPGVVIEDDVTIGNSTCLHANVTIAKECRIGNKVIIHSGTVVGSDGYGFATDQKGKHIKRPQVGIVQIDDDVEIGANCAIDRATFGKTWIKQGTKIDNLVQVAHNVEVGQGSLLVAQVGISGSTVLGNGVVVGGQSGVAGHIKIGDRAMVAGMSGVHNNVDPGTVVAGIPAFPHRKWLRACAVIPKLPEIAKEVRALMKKVNENE